MTWAKARQRGNSGYGEDINKKLNTLLHLLMLLHPREFCQGRQDGVTFKTSMERKLRERHRESKSSLVSTSIIYNLKLNSEWLEYLTFGFREIYIVQFQMNKIKY